MQSEPTQEPHQPLRWRLLVAVSAIVFVFTVGTYGFYLLGRGQWRLGDCAYMTVISLTTVGYGEVLSGLDKVPYARLFTALLLVSGAGVVVYSVSVLTTFLIEGEFFQLRRKRKMSDRINKMSNHIVVCGAGRTAQHVCGELDAARWPLVVIDEDYEAIKDCQEACGRSFDHIVGDATDDSVLLEAGITRAHGAIAALPDDKDNLFVVVTARGLNPQLRVVTKAVNPRSVSKLHVGGAERVVSVNRLGGQTMASEMIRPNVVNFLDTLVRDRDKNLRFEELTIPEGSALAGKQLAESHLRAERQLLVVAATTGHQDYSYSPGPNFTLEAGMTLIVIGETDSVRRLRASGLFASD